MDAKLINRINRAHWVCFECGKKYGKGSLVTVSTWHDGQCEICDETKSVTEFRDFGYSKYEKPLKLDDHIKHLLKL